MYTSLCIILELARRLAETRTFVGSKGVGVRECSLFSIHRLYWGLGSAVLPWPLHHNLDTMFKNEMTELFVT